MPDRDTQQTILRRTVSEAIASSGLTFTEVANALGVEPQAVTLWRQTGKITTHNLVGLARLTRWSLDRLLTGEDGPLTPDERAVLDLYRTLTPAGQALANALLRSLSQTHHS